MSETITTIKYLVEEQSKVVIKKIYNGAKKYWHPYLINTIEMRVL